MKITLKHYGVTYSIETKEDDFDAAEMINTFNNLMLCAGFSEKSVQNAILDAAEEIRFNIDREQMSVNKN